MPLNQHAITPSSPTRRPIKRPSRAALFAVPVAVLSLVACSSRNAPAEDVDFSAEATGTLNAWGFDNADDVGQARLDYAEEQLSDLDVELDATGFDAQKFTTRMAGGNIPDAVQMDRQLVATYAAQGLIVPLDECFAAHDVDPDERWYPNVVDDVRYDDKVWAVPQFYQPPAILLNMRVLEDEGIEPEQIDTSDTDALVEAVEAMYEADGGTPTRLGLDPNPTGQGPLWLLGMGGRLVDDDGKPTLDDPANVAGLEMLKKILDAQGGFAKTQSFTDSFDAFGENNQFVADQVAAQVDAQWYPNVLSPYVDDVDLGAVPFRGTDGKPFSVAGGSSFVIPANAANPDAACEWMLQLTTLDAWKAAGQARADSREADGGINTGLFTGSPEADQYIKETWVEPSGNEGFDQVIETYYDMLDYGVSPGASPAGQEIQSELTNAITSVMGGDTSPQDALAEAQAAAQRAYESTSQE